MLYNVSQLLRSPVGETRHYAIEHQEPVHRGSATLTRVPGGVLVAVSADVIIDSVCSRCLAPFGYPAHIDFEEIFVQQIDPVTGARIESDDNEDAFRISENHLIDIREAVRQYIEMASAMQPLCAPDCPGICPDCGQDLALGPCRCEGQGIDTRWSALAALKQTFHG